MPHKNAHSVPDASEDGVPPPQEEDQSGAPPHQSLSDDGVPHSRGPSEDGVPLSPREEIVSILKIKRRKRKQANVGADDDETIKTVEGTLRGLGEFVGRCGEYVGRHAELQQLNQADYHQVEGEQQTHTKPCETRRLDSPALPGVR